MAKTSLRKNAGVSLTAEDLINPHEFSNIPGYGGYTPQLPFHCGHTYGYLTDKLLKRRTNETTHSLAVDDSSLKSAFLPKGDGSDRKFVEKMVPGYTGFVPQHRFTYGKTYRDGSEDAIALSKMTFHNNRQKHADLLVESRSNPKLQTRSSFVAAEVSHPILNSTKSFDYPTAHFSDRRGSSEAAMPGYSGYVPQHENFKTGARFGRWTKHAYAKSLHDRSDQDSVLAFDVDLPASVRKHYHTPTWPTVVDDQVPSSRFGSIYNKDLGMVPRYTGFVPQRRFDFGVTYGDSTRSLPVCQDTPGYASGKYLNPGPPFAGTVIPVRQ